MTQRIGVGAGGAASLHEPHGDLATDAEAFTGAAVAWLNARLVPRDVVVDASTPLFESGLIDSIRILKLIAWTERALGRVIPDEQILMENFRTVERMAETFLRGQRHVDR